MSKTKVVIEDSSYGKMFSVVTVLGKTGEGVDILDSKPAVKFGLKKAKALIPYLEELKDFAESD